MELNAQVIGAAVALSVLNNRLVEYLLTPLWERFKWPKKPWLMYAAMVTGIVLGMLAGLNVFGELFPPLVGQIITALLIGGGSNLIYDALQIGKPAPPTGGQ